MTWPTRRSTRTTAGHGATDGRGAGAHPAVRRSIGRPAGARTISVVGFGISRKRLEQAIRDLQLPVLLVREPDEADVVITLRNLYARSRRSSVRRRRAASPSTC